MSASGTEQQTKVLVFGLGAIGGFYAFILSRSLNISLSVIARSNYSALQQNGLQIDSQNHGTHRVPLNNIYKSPSEAAPNKFDYIVCAHKAISPESIPPLFKDVSSDSTTFVIIQNGVGNEDPFRQTFPNNTIISCVTWTGATQKMPGIITHTPNEDMQIGLYPNPNLDAGLEQQRLQQFASFLKTGGTKFSIEEDIQIPRWEKCVWNAAWNPLTTLTGVPVQKYLSSSPEAQSTTRRLMSEMILVARKCCGVPLADDLAEGLISKVLAMPTPIYSSMYVDAKEGRPLETEAIIGFPMRRARECGMEGEVPTLATIWALTNAVNQRLSEGT